MKFLLNKILLIVTTFLAVLFGNVQARESVELLLNNGTVSSLDNPDEFQQLWNELMNYQLFAGEHMLFHTSEVILEDSLGWVGVRGYFISDFSALNFAGPVLVDGLMDFRIVYESNQSIFGGPVRVSDAIFREGFPPTVGDVFCSDKRFMDLPTGKIYRMFMKKIVMEIVPSMFPI